MSKRRNRYGRRPPQPIPEHVTNPPQIEEPPFALIGLSAQPDVQGGYHIHMRLSTFDDEDPNTRVSVVDVLAIALVRLLKNPPDILNQEVDRVNSLITKFQEALYAEGADQSALIEEFNRELGVSEYVQIAPAAND
jgi:hypothetical protein